MNNQLVFVQSHQINEIPYTAADIIAEYSENDRRSINRLITKYKNDLEELGILRFEIAKLKGAGKPRKVYLLNEPQATLLITFLDNTPVVVGFKKRLVKQFYEIQKELAIRKAHRDLEKPIRRSLTDTIKDWEHFNAKSYIHFTNLVCKAVTGLNTGLLKKERQQAKDKPIYDVLTSDELAQYRTVENQVITLLELQLSYNDIKTMILGQNKKSASHHLPSCKETLTAQKKAI